jgi:hypothetical protein
MSERLYFGRMRVLGESRVREGTAELYLTPGNDPEILIPPASFDQLCKKELYITKPRKGSSATHDARTLCFILGLELKILHIVS